MVENNTTPKNNKSDNSETVKSIIYFMLALLVFIIFKPTFEGLYKSIFVELFDVFNIKNFTLKQSYFTLLSWLALNVIATSYVFYLIWKNYRLSLNSYLIGLFSLLLFVFYRYFDTPTFIFYPIGTDIKFADVFLVYFLLGFLLFLKNKYYVICVIFYGNVKNYLFSKIWVSNTHKNLTKKLITLNKQLIRRKKQCIKSLKSFQPYNFYRRLKICLKKGFYKIIRLLRPQKQENIYKNDLPTNTDTLGRNHASDHLASNILSNYSEKALAIGIMGTWGTGKTTFLNFIKNSLEIKSKEQANKSQQLIMIDFNAWFSKKPEQITQDFFDVLKNKIGEYSGELSDEITSYAQKLVTGQKGTLIDIFKEVFSIFASKETPAELYEKINSALQKLNFKLVIFIDDLDRLDKKEIVEVLRIIRNTANFHNTVFVVAYDRNYVINAIKDINDHNKERYLEKIFQLEIALPYTEKKTIINQLQEWLEIWIKGNIATDLQADLIEGQYGLKQIFINRDKIVNDFIITMRDASRFYNLFITEYHNNVRGEILLEHFVLIKLLLFKYPSVYELIKNQKNKFLQHDYEYLKDIEGDNKQSVFKNYLQENKDLLLISAEDIKSIVKIYDMFFVAQSLYKPYKNYLFISYDKSFRKYFANKTMLKDFKEKDFEEISKLDYDVTKLIAYTDYLYDFKERYNNRRVDNEDIVIIKHTIKVILALYYYDLYKNENPPNRNSNNDLFVFVSIRLKRLNEESKEEVDFFLKEIFTFKYNDNENKHLWFNACVAYLICSEEYQLYYRQEEEDQVPDIVLRLADNNYEPYNKYLNNNKPFFKKTTIWLKEQCENALQKAIKEGQYDSPDNLIKLYYYNYNITGVINEDFIQYIAKKEAETEFVLNGLIEYGDYKRLSKEKIEQIFGSYERFEKFLNEEIEETAFVKEYRKAYQYLKE
jgi:hypothetical protein